MHDNYNCCAVVQYVCSVFVEQHNNERGLHILYCYITTGYTESRVIYIHRLHKASNAFLNKL
jgi:hypothetical protein